MKFRRIKNLKRKGKTRDEKLKESSRQAGIKTLLKHNNFNNPKSIKKRANTIRGRKRPDLTLKMLTNNPMKNPDIAKKKGQTQKGRKNPKHSLLMSGRKVNPNCEKDLAKYLMIHGHPMKNPELIKKSKFNDRRNFKFEKNPKLLKQVIEEFNQGKSITQIAKELKMDTSTISKALKRNGITFDIKERLKIYSKTNVNIQRGQFKKGNISWNKNSKVYKGILAT